MFMHITYRSSQPCRPAFFSWKNEGGRVLDEIHPGGCICVAPQLKTERFS